MLSVLATSKACSLFESGAVKVLLKVRLLIGSLLLEVFLKDMEGV